MSLLEACIAIVEPGHHAPRATAAVDADTIPTFKLSTCTQCRTRECAPSRRVCTVCISRRQETKRRNAGLPPTIQKDTP